MGCDMVLALGRAAINGRAVFGVNLYGAPRHRVRRFAGRCHAVGETVVGPRCSLPEARQTSAIVGLQPHGTWGLTCGLNAHHLALGLATWKSKLPGVAGGLTGTDLVRLTLERSHSFSHGLDTLTELIVRHGVGLGAPAEASDPAFLIADGKDAAVVEAAGRHWAMLDVQEVRAVSDVALIRQDWTRLSAGLADEAVHQGSWHGDGSKLDFAAIFERLYPARAWALKRWGRATLLLEQQNGAIDYEVMRRLLAEHYEAIVAPLAVEAGARDLTQLTSFVASMSAKAELAPVAWFAGGPPSNAVYFPLLPDGELPELFEIDEGFGPTSLQIGNSADNLQARLDAAVEEFTANVVRTRESHDQLRRLATQFMQLLAAGVSRTDRGTGNVRRAAPNNTAADLSFVAE